MKIRNLLTDFVICLSILVGCSNQTTVYKNTFTVRFHSNGGSGEMETVTFIQGQSQSLPACAYEAPTTDQEFYGWTLKSTDRNIKYTNAQSIVVSKNLDLFACWGDKARYTIREQFVENPVICPLWYPSNGTKVSYFQNGGLPTWYCSKTVNNQTRNIDDIPFLDMDVVYGLISNNETYDGNAIYSYEVDGNKYKIKRSFTNLEGLTIDATLTFDFDNQTIYCNDFDGFNVISDSGTSIDIAGFVSDSQNKYRIYKQDASFNRIGHSVTFNCAKYNIPMIKQNGRFYIPAQLLSVVVFSKRLKAFTYHNGEYFIWFGNKGYRDLYPTTSSVPSEDLRIFNYNMLCFTIDYFYGLLKDHNIDSIDYLFTKQSDLKTTFLNGDNNINSMKALNKFCYIYSADSHTYMNLFSPYAGNTDSTWNQVCSVPMHPSKVRLENIETQMKALRYNNYSGSTYSVTSGSDTYEYKTSTSQKFTNFNNKFGITARQNGSSKNIPSFTVVEKYKNDSKVANASVAYLTFDEFTANFNSDAEKPWTYSTSQTYIDNLDAQTSSVPALNTLGLIIYAQNKILEDRNIKTLVIDLSNNLGGACAAGATILAWVMGQSTTSMKSNLTGAICSKNYLVDLNDDLQFGEAEDKLPDDVKVYCIISGVSFSCANYVASQFKGSGRVTLLGDTSGGGLCAVETTTTADGAFFTFSSHTRLERFVNGIGYSTDTGISPDIYISDMSLVYNRPKFTRYLEELK